MTVSPPQPLTILERLGVQQRVLPTYRCVFLEALAAVCVNGLGVFAGQPRPDEMIEGGQALVSARFSPANNHHLLRGGAYLCWQQGFIPWLAAWQPLVLVVEANPRYLSTPAAVRWMKRRGRAVIGWGLGAPQPTGGLGSLRRALWKGFIHQFDALIAYSSRGAAQYIALGANPGRVFVAPNAVAARPTQPPPERPPYFEQDRPALLFVGRLQQRKRLDVLLHACAGLPPAQQPRLTIVGEGPARPALEALAASVYPRAHFTGALHGQALLPYFAAADLFVLPGTGGLAVQQAMSCGLPVVVAEGDGTQADLVRPQNGWLVPPGDEAALRQVLQQALSDAATLRRMGEESYRIVRDEINLEGMLRVFARAVESVRR